MVERVFRPASSLLGRLRFAQKFVVVVLVLALPLGVVVLTYASEQHSRITASQTERVGLAAMRPLLRLAEDVATARHAAATSGDAVAVPRADLDTVDETQRQYSGLLNTAGQWHEVRQQLVLAGTTSGHATSLAAYDGVGIGVEHLIVAVGDGSRLSVDPDLDSSYLIDAIERRIPSLLDTGTRIVDQLNVDAREGFPDRAESLSQVDGAVGSIDDATDALDLDIETAAQHTIDKAVRYDLPAREATLDGTVSLLDEALANVQFTHDSISVVAATSRPLTVATNQLASAAMSATDRLLRARIAADTNREHLVELVAAAATLAATYLFGGFYYCVVGAVRRIVTTLSHAADGRLDEQIDITNRDELGFVAAAVNGMLRRVRDATERLAHDAAHDALTGLPNRSSVIAELQCQLPRANRQQSLSVLFVDLDGFKLINDSLGHATGDEVLREVSTRLLRTMRTGDTVARLSGDEFLVVCPGLADVPAAIAVAERILAAVTPQMTVRAPGGERRRVSVGASIGVAFVIDPTTSADQLVRDADVAMYRAKELGRGRVEVFSEGMKNTAQERQQLGDELRQAVTEGEVLVYYQPIVEIRTGRIRGFEALARWAHPERGILLPGTFMATAESSGLVIPLGACVLREACRQLAVWQADAAMPPGLHMSVNLSARQLADDDIVDVVVAAVTETDLQPQSLWLEIAESALLANADTATNALLRLHASGARLVLDDFGTGYSSLQHLKIFPLDVIKIDRSFVSGIGEDDGDEAIISAVIGLANALGFTVVAEGVETSKQSKWLLDLGCNLAQGYLFARPAPEHEISGQIAALRMTGVAPV
jgi:diguanylate cyclase (GGDEF)-like protein